MSNILLECFCRIGSVFERKWTLINKVHHRSIDQSMAYPFASGLEVVFELVELEILGREAELSFEGGEAFSREDWVA